jgi:hypothetical protein
MGGWYLFLLAVPDLRSGIACRIASGMTNLAGHHAFISHSWSGSLWNFHTRFGPAMTLR